MFTLCLSSFGGFWHSLYVDSRYLIRSCLCFRQGIICVSLVQECAVQHNQLGYC